MNNTDPTKSEGKSVEEIQQEPMPSSEEQNEAVTGAVDSNEVGTSEETLPEDVSERTRKNFEKLQAKLAEKEARLKELEQASYGTSVFDSLRGGTPQEYTPSPQLTEFLSPQKVQEITQQFVDKDGYVDIDGVNRAFLEAKQEAVEAKERARQIEEKVARLEENQQVREAHAQFPELDPLNKEKFNPAFYEQVRDRMVRNMWEGKNQSFAQAAADIKSAYYPQIDPKEVEKKAVETYKESQKARDQEPFENGKGQSRQSDDDLDELRARTRKGDDSALFERLKRAGY